MKGDNGLLRKIDKMHYLFGKSDGKCKNCEHYSTFKYHDKSYRKCEEYGITQSEASDWKAGYEACGLFPNKENPYGRYIMELRIGGKCRKKKQEEQIDGQMTLF